MSSRNLLIEIKELLEEVDDYHQPWSHNAYMVRVENMIDRVDVILKMKGNISND